MLTDNVVSLGIGMGNKTIDLLWVHTDIPHKAHHWQWGIARLYLHHAKIHTASINTRRGTGF